MGYTPYGVLTTQKKAWGVGFLTAKSFTLLHPHPYWVLAEVPWSICGRWYLFCGRGRSCIELANYLRPKIGAGCPDVG